MRHINNVSRQRPAKAQFEEQLQLIALIQSVLGLIEAIAEALGKQKR